MYMRAVNVKRETKETKIAIRLNPDGAGNVSVDSGVPFFDHMLTAMAKHGGFDLTCTVQGDLGVDSHHTIEDIGIVMGDAIKEAIGDGRGICRFAHAVIPMDESLAQVALDCGGRGYLVFSGTFGNKIVGSIPGISSSITFTRSVREPVSPPISPSPAKMTIISARRSSRRSALRSARRSHGAETRERSGVRRGSLMPGLEH